MVSAATQANCDILPLSDVGCLQLSINGLPVTESFIEQDTEILTRYWHNKKDAWQNIFVCECCACTNHTRHASDPPELEAKSANGTALSPGHPPSTDLDLPTTHQKPRHDVPTSIKQDYPDSEIDAWDWEELEASSPIETSLFNPP